MFKYINDLTLALTKVARALKTGAAFIVLFASREVWRQGHIEILCAQRFAKVNHVARYAYTLAMRRLSFGYNKGGKSAAESSRNAHGWIDAWTFYRTFTEVTRLASPNFEINDYGADYMHFQFERHAPLCHISPWPVFVPISRRAVDGLAGLV